MREIERKRLAYDLAILMSIVRHPGLSCDELISCVIKDSAPALADYVCSYRPFYLQETKSKKKRPVPGTIRNRPKGMTPKGARILAIRSPKRRPE